MMKEIRIPVRIAVKHFFFYILQGRFLQIYLSPML